MRPLSRLRREQDGIALIVVLLVLLVIGLLSTALVLSATQSSSTAVTNTNKETALAAANAGLAAAVYRLSQQSYNGTSSNPILAQCFTTKFTAVNATTGECPEQKESTVSRGEYKYYVSPEMGSSSSCTTSGSAPCWPSHTTSSCTGYPVESSNGIGLSQRCVTSIGIFNGVKVRVQERVVDYSETFPVSGLLSLGNILFDTKSNSTSYGGYDGCPTKKHPPCPPAYLNGNFEANGTISFEGSSAKPNEDVVNGSITTGPLGKVIFKEQAYNCPSGKPASEEAYPGKETLCEVKKEEAGFTAPTYTAELSQYEASATVNNNAALDELATSKVNSEVKPYTNAPNPRTFILKASAKNTAAKPVLIPGGTYNFCSFEVNNGYIQIEKGQSVTIFIDNSTTNDGCKTGGIDGQLKIPGSGFLNLNSDPRTLTINVCGDPAPATQTKICGPWTGTGPCSGGPPCTKQTIGLVTLNDDLNSTGGPEGNGMTYGDIYAPNSAFTTTGEGLRWTGGIVVASWESNDNDWIQAAPGYNNNPTLAFYPVAYHRCPPTYGSDPSAGCY